MEFSENYYKCGGLGIGYPMLFLFFSGVMYFVLLALIELKMFAKLKYMIMPGKEADSGM